MGEFREQMRTAVADFLRAEAGPARRRAALDGEHGYDRALFERASTEIGLGALVVPESLGGLGLGFADAAMVIAELGRGLTPGPMLDTLVAASVLTESGSAGPVASVLSTVATVPTAIAVAGLTHRPGATVTLSDGRLNGRAVAVPFGAAADLFLVLTGTGTGAELHLVEPDRPGVTVTERRALDHTRRLAELDFAAVEAATVSCEDSGHLAERLVGLYRIALAVESAAAARACLDLTVDHLKTREQFGRVIGSFQALKHRCADLAVAVDGAEATADHAVELAASGAPVDALGDRFAVVAALAKTVTADTLFEVAADCLQLHGGVGFTFEHDVQLFLKRAKGNQLLAGTGSELRSEIATRIGAGGSAWVS